MTHQIRLRPFEASDTAACLAIFDSNLPKFFAPDEREMFADWLARYALRDPRYQILCEGPEIRGCGGLSMDDGVASLTWGMIDQAHHGRGLGRRLTLERLAQARALPGLRGIALSTSQHSAGFYEKLGFLRRAHLRDGYFPGIDRVDMELLL